MTVFVIVPVKKLDEAKSRLSPLLADSERELFCLRMLEDVLGAVGSVGRPHRTVVVGADAVVSLIARRLGARFLPETRPGLNRAVSEATAWCIREGAESALILPADIPLAAPQDLDGILSLGEEAAVVISPSRGGEGTNALLLTPPDAIPPSYGRRSFQRHAEEASRRGIRLHMFKSLRIALDIDTPRDLTDFLSLSDGWTRTYKFLERIGAAERLRRMEEWRGGPT